MPVLLEDKQNVALQVANRGVRVRLSWIVQLIGFRLKCRLGNPGNIRESDCSEHEFWSFFDRYRHIDIVERFIKLKLQRLDLYIGKPLRDIKVLQEAGTGLQISLHKRELLLKLGEPGPSCPDHIIFERRRWETLIAGKSDLAQLVVTSLANV